MNVVDKSLLTPVERLANKFVWCYDKARDEDARPIDRRVAGAKLGGMATAAYALGYGHTEFHVEIEVLQIMRDRPQPPWQATGVNAARFEWETEATHAVARALEAIYTN